MTLRNRPKVQVQLLDQSYRCGLRPIYGSRQQRQLSNDFKTSGRTSTLQSMFCVGVQAQNVRRACGKASRQPGNEQQEGGRTCSR